MGKMSKILLWLAIAGLVVGVAFASNLIDAHGVVAWYVVLPVGAIFFGLFLISFMLEEEVAFYDAEQRIRQKATRSPDAKLIERPAAAPATGPKSRPARMHEQKG
jgi:hypothetical protein